MPDIKGLSHQSIHSTKPEPAETSSTASQPAKQDQPVESQTLTKKQQDIIKQSKTAEGKLTESAIRADVGSLLEKKDKAHAKAPDTLKSSPDADAEPGVDPTNLDHRVSPVLIKALRESFGDEEPIKLKKFFKDPFRHQYPQTDFDLEVREEEPITATSESPDPLKSNTKADKKQGT